jgi:biopolymer transport protein ExbD
MSASITLAQCERHLRRIRRVERFQGYEIRDLNITPMLDMMTILLVFLLKSFAVSPENVDVSSSFMLARSTTQLPIEDALMVTVTRHEIFVDRERVATLDDAGSVEADDRLVRPLYDALETRVHRLKEIDRFGGARFSGRVAIVADERVPYRTLLCVLSTAARADLGAFKLFVEKRDD